MKSTPTRRAATKRVWLIGTGVLALCSTLVLAQDAPVSLLPPGFDDPAPKPSPAPTPRPSRTGAPSAPSAPSAQSSGSPSPGSSPVVQPLPSTPSAASGRSEPSVPSAPVALPSGLPSIADLENLSTDELDEALGLKPKFDIPPAARRTLEQIGVLAPEEGGLPTGSLTNQPASIVRAALAGTKGPLVSRWGHILLRRALGSRLAAPKGMDAVDFAALRASTLNTMGEHAAARALVQDIDSADWNERLIDAAMDAYLGTSDIAGACPVVRLQGSKRTSGQGGEQWKLLQSICNAFAGEGARAGADLTRALRNNDAPAIDILLAQRFAGAAGRGRRAVNLEWDDVEELTPWRFALATAVGAQLPERMTDNLTPYYERIEAVSPALGLAQRASGAQRAGREGILSSEAMVDLYSRIYAADGITGKPALTAARLRQAYVALNPATRMAAIQDIWGISAQNAGKDARIGADNAADYSRMVLTAYAAARMPAEEALQDNAGALIASMLTAGLDRDALQWGPVVTQGSAGWAQLVLVQPQRPNPVSESVLDDFVDDDTSEGQRKSRFLLAGLAGLGRIDDSARADFSDRLGINLMRQSKWSQLITRAAEVGNQPLVAMLAGLGMQGSGWDKMTARNLYRIVYALDRVGLSAEARLIAAEAVARG